MLFYGMPLIIKKISSYRTTRNHDDMYMYVCMFVCIYVFMSKQLVNNVYLTNIQVGARLYTEPQMSAVIHTYTLTEFHINKYVYGCSYVNKYEHMNISITLLQSVS